MLVCVECGHLFEVPKRVVDRHGLDTPPFEEYDTCPACEGGGFIDAFACAECGEYITDRYIKTESGATLCDSCTVSRRLCED